MKNKRVAKKSQKITYEEGLKIVKAIQKKIEILEKKIKSPSATSANERLLRFP
ncbi:MAG: hypothetical protein HYT83_01885 [Candidatus Levybacteria bacterium]|nr:hypothetical protein [Candidatus Levybacteria bacterium]